MLRLRTIVLSLLALLVLDPAVVAVGPLDPPGTGGVGAVDRALSRLATHRRLLIVGAHPDDEDTTLLALESLARGGEAAYLSLTRGEGGQNVIGDELGEALGVLRTRELLAARQIDGARQYFGRAYDYGYSKTLDEALRLWPRETLLEDVVRIIRRFRPQVVVSVFPATPEAGHGQHQVAGWATERGFVLAADEGALPDLAAEGLAPWRPRCLYREAWWRQERATLVAPSDVVHPITGHTVSQLAARSRSRHRSQTMGRLEELSGRPVRLERVDGLDGAGFDCPAGNGSDPFAGFDTRLGAIADLIPDPELSSRVRSRLARVEQLALVTRERLSPRRLHRAVAPLAEIVRELGLARNSLARSPSAGATHAAALVDEKARMAEVALAAAAGLVLDATTDREALAPGEAVTVTTRLFRGRPAATSVDAEADGASGAVDILTSGEALTVDSPVGAAPAVAAPAPPQLAPGALHEHEHELVIADAAVPSVPYFLRRPREGWIYDLEGVPAEVRGEPLGPPVLVASVETTIAGVPVRLERPVVSRHRDPVTGEVRRPLRLVPRVEIEVEPEVIVRPLSEVAAREVGVTLTAHGQRPVQGRLAIDVPEGWRSVGPTAFQLAAGATSSVVFELAPSGASEPGRRTVEVRAVTRDSEYAEGYPLVDHPHVAPTPVPRAARVELVAVELELPTLERVGYVRGAADEMPEALAAVGVPVELLTPAELGAADLSGLDAVVVGPRAFESSPELFEVNHRLLAYARNGGLLIVQYQRPPYAERAAPYPMEMPRRGAPRTVDETARVELLDSNHPVLRRPNPIGAADWEGWIQERGLYYPSDWDPRYTPLLAMADPGEEAERGALLVAPFGDGHYVYTGLAFFRQLPAGVAGAYRLFANLLALEPTTIEEEEIDVETLEVEGAEGR